MKEKKKKSIWQILRIISIVFTCMLLFVGVLLLIDPASGLSPKSMPDPLEVHPYSEEAQAGEYVTLQLTDAQILLVTTDLEDGDAWTQFQTEGKTPKAYETIDAYLLCHDTNHNAVILRRQNTVWFQKQEDFALGYDTQLNEIYADTLAYAEEISRDARERHPMTAQVADPFVVQGTKDRKYSWYLEHDQNFDFLSYILPQEKIEQLLSDPSAIQETEEWDPSAEEEIRLIQSTMGLEPVLEVPELENEEAFKKTLHDNRLAAMQLIAWCLFWLWLLHFLKKRRKRKADALAAQLAEQREKEKQEAAEQAAREMQEKQEQAARKQQEEQEKLLHLQKQKAQEEKAQKEAELQQEKEAAEQKARLRQEKEAAKQKAEQEEVERKRRMAMHAEEVLRRKKAKEERRQALLQKARAMAPRDQEIVHPAGQIKLLEAVIQVDPACAILKQEGHAAFPLYTEEITDGVQMLQILQGILSELMILLDKTFSDREENWTHLTEEDLLLAVKALDFYEEYSVGSDSFLLVKQMLIEKLADRDEEEADLADEA